MPGAAHTPSGWLWSAWPHGRVGCCSQIQPTRHFPHVIGSLMVRDSRAEPARRTGPRRGSPCGRQARVQGGRCGSDRPSSAVVDPARAQSGCYRPDRSRAWPSGGTQAAGPMAILERAAGAAFEKVPAFDRPHAAQHGRPVDERPVALGTEQLRGWRLRGRREHSLTWLTHRVATSI